MKKFILTFVVIILFGQVVFSEQNNQLPLKMYGNTNNIILNKNVSYIGGWAYGPCKSCCICNDYAYIGHGGVLEVIDVSDKQFPLQAGQINSNGVIENIWVKNDYAFVAAGKAGFKIFDISDPSYPVEFGVYDPDMIAFDSFIAGNIAYIAFGKVTECENIQGILTVLDISDLSSPQEIASLQIVKSEILSCKRNKINVHVSGNHAYFSTDVAGVAVVDISDPYSPEKLGFSNITFSPGDLKVEDDIAFISGAVNGLHIMNFTDALRPIEISFINTKTEVTELWIEEKKLFFSTLNKVYIFDISNHSQPLKVGSFPTKGNTYDISVSDLNIYVADGNAGFLIYDIYDPVIPSMASYLKVRDVARDVCVCDGYAYLADCNSGLRVLKVENLNSPEEISCCEMKHDALDIFVSGDFAFVPNMRSGLSIINISNREKPLKVGQWRAPVEAVSVYVENDYAYLVVGDAGFVVLDISDPAHPRDVGYWDNPGYASDIHVVDGYAFVADGSSGLRIVDVSDPTTPFETSSFSKESNVSTIVVKDGYAYFSAGKYITILDVSDPLAPVKTGLLNMGAHVNDLCGIDRFMYVAKGINVNGFNLMGSGSVDIIDILNPNSPEKVGYFETAGYPNRLCANENIIYVADDQDGLYILRNDLMVEIRGVSSTLPHKHILSQNSPNPFNPSTKIVYDLPGDAHVVLTIYDVMGRMVRQYDFGFKNSGKHTFHWNANEQGNRQLTSGIYFYEMKAIGEKSYRDIKKMLLVK